MDLKNVIIVKPYNAKNPDLECIKSNFTSVKKLSRTLYLHVTYLKYISVHCAIILSLKETKGLNM